MFWKNIWKNKPTIKTQQLQRNKRGVWRLGQHLPNCSLTTKRDDWLANANQVFCHCHAKYSSVRMSRFSPVTVFLKSPVPPPTTTPTPLITPAPSAVFSTLLSWHLEAASWRSCAERRKQKIKIKKTQTLVKLDNGLHPLWAETDMRTNWHFSKRAQRIDAPQQQRGKKHMRTKIWQRSSSCSPGSHDLPLILLESRLN